MIRKKIFAIFAVAALPCALAAQDARAVVAASAKAMGIENLSSLGSFMYTGTGANFAFGEASTPGAASPRQDITKYSRVIDFDGDGSWEEIVHPPSVGQQDPQVETTRIPFVGDYGRIGEQYDIWMTPIGFLKGALSHDATTKTVTVGGRRWTTVSFVSDGKYTITGYFDSQNFLDKIETRIDNPALGDIPVETDYTGYKDFHHGLIFPAHVVKTEGTQPVLDLAINNAARNVVKYVGELTYNQVNRGAQEYRGKLLGDAPPVFVDQVLYGDSVYDFAVKDTVGQVHHSVLMEFNDYLVVVEAPIDEEHASAVIAEIRKIFPKKPIRYVVNTNAHFTEVGGLRTYAAAGATIITQAENMPWLGQALNRPRTIQKDKLSRLNRKPVIETVAEKRVLTDGAHTIELDHVSNDHVKGLLIAYLPKEKLVLESDLFTVRPPKTEIDTDGHAKTIPYPPDAAYASILIGALDHLKLDYETILCLQGRAAQKSELLGQEKPGAAKLASK